MSRRSTFGSRLLACGLALSGLSLVGHPYAAAFAQDSATSCANTELAPTAPIPLEGEHPPPNATGPTEVGIAIQVLELREIDPVQGSYRVRGYVRTSWCDRRLAFDPNEQGVDELIYVGAAAEAQLHERVWIPSAFPVNQVGEMSFSERVLRIRHDGTVEQDLNLDVILASHFDLHRFPFDTQTLRFEIESFVYPASKVLAVADETRTGFGPDARVAEWELLSATGSTRTVDVMRSREPFSRYTLSIEIARKQGFYLWKVFLPLLIIIALSWSIFWMPDESFASRSRISATGVLTIVAYQFAFAADLPRIGYLTLLDITMILSFGLIAVTVLESLLVSAWKPTHPRLALRIDKTSRVLFPVTYGLMLLLVFLLGG